MTYEVSSTPLSTAANSATPTQRDVSGAHPLRAWRAIREAVLFMVDVVSDARRLRNSLHRRYVMIEE